MTAPAMLLEWSPRRPDHSRRHRARRRFVALVMVVAVMTVAVPVAAVGSVFRWSGVDDRTHTDAIVVLGAAQYQGTPSPVLANRLAHAHELVDAGVSTQVITVGGFQDGDITSEAQTGKEELVADGLRRRQVIALPYGENTAESLEAVAAIIAAEGIESVTIVTDPAHSARARALAEHFGMQAHVSATAEGPGTSLTSEYVIRESAGLISVWLNL
ncbi:MAG: YdcF family protein [Actinomycetota bacterium]|nr:YdcF family protein [Actinomycetota bacterium]MDH4016822.1 YdcF family protein [Actinomycetota bacterium]